MAKLYIYLFNVVAQQNPCKTVSAPQFFAKHLPCCVLGELLHKDNATSQLLVPSIGDFYQDSVEDQEAIIHFASRSEKNSWMASSVTSNDKISISSIRRIFRKSSISHVIRGKCMNNMYIRDNQTQGMILQPPKALHIISNIM